MERPDFIVRKLAEAPFKRRMNLVDFDELGEKELQQLLIDVLAEFDERMKMDAREVDVEEMASTVLNFLHLLSYSPPNGDKDALRENILNAEKDAVHGVLFWALRDFRRLKKRAFVARYLGSLGLPPGMEHNPDIKDLLERHRELQQEFKETHKQLDEMRESSDQPNMEQLKEDIGQLESEIEQLQSKIEELQRRTRSMKGFKELLEVTSALRKTQEREAELHDRIHEQTMRLQAEQRRYNEARRRQEQLRGSLDDGASPEDMLMRLQREVEEHRRQAREVLPDQISQREGQLRELRRALEGPMRTEREVDELRMAVSSAEAEIEQLGERIQEAQQSSAGSGVEGFWTKVKMVQRRLLEKEAERDAAQADQASLKRRIKEEESRLSELKGPGHMGEREMRQYATRLKEKTLQYKQMKGEYGVLQREVTVLKRTEQILRARDDNLKDFVAKLEEKKGVTGYRDVHSELQKVSEDKAKADKAKGQTLEEISSIVSRITRMLDEKKTKLAPQVKRLRERRAEFQQLEAQHREKRAVFENTAVGLETERMALEEQCGEAQEEALQMESQFHRLHCMAALTGVRAKRAELEEELQGGGKQLMRGTATQQDMVKQAVTQSETLIKTLRKKKIDLRDNGETHAEQRVKFTRLQQLLEAKHRSVKQQQEEAKAQDEAGSLLHEVDSMVGGANVMKIDE